MDVTGELIRLTEVVKQESLRLGRLEQAVKDGQEKHESFRDEIRNQITEMKIELKATVMKVGMLCGGALIIVEAVLRLVKF